MYNEAAVHPEDVVYEVLTSAFTGALPLSQGGDLKGAGEVLDTAIHGLRGLGYPSAEIGGTLLRIVDQYKLTLQPAE